MTIVIGYWIIPTILTLAFFGVAWVQVNKVPSNVWLGNAIEGLIFYGTATIVSLVAWLAYAFLR